MSVIKINISAFLNLFRFLYYIVYLQDVVKISHVSQTFSSVPVTVNEFDNRCQEETQTSDSNLLQFVGGFWTPRPRKCLGIWTFGQHVWLSVYVGTADKKQMIWLTTEGLNLCLPSDDLSHQLCGGSITGEIAEFVFVSWLIAFRCIPHNSKAIWVAETPTESEAGPDRTEHLTTSF